VTALRWLNRHIGVAVVLTLILPFVVVGASVLLADFVTRLPPDAALRVYDKVVTKTALDQRVRILGALYGVRAPSDPQQLDLFRRVTAQSVATSVVLDHAVADHNLAVSDQEAHGLLMNFVNTLNPPGADSFVQLLHDTGASESDVVDELKRRVAASRLMDQVTQPAAAGVDEAYVRSYYQEHRSEIAVPERRHLRNIVVTREDQADSLLNELHGGADFGAVAKRSSLDSDTSGGGGDLGVLTSDQLQPDYAKAAFSAPANSLFGPVHTPDGWNIGQVLEVTPATPLTFEQVHDRLAVQLSTKKAGDLWHGWLEQQIKLAHVEYALQYQPPADDNPAEFAGGPAQGVKIR
jgi:peptidyl-prolyl cis-trans isomerase C